MLKKIILLLVAIVPMIIPVRAGNNEIFSYHCPLGCPTTKSADLAVVIHYPFISGIDKQSKQTLWVAYAVNSLNFGGAKRTKFKADPLLPNQLKQTGNYYKGLYKLYGLSRGHIAPKASFDINKNVVKQTFYFSNIIPQPNTLNIGIWNRIEQWERKNHPLYIIAGATKHQNLTKRIFWKIILDKNKNNIYGLIFKKNNKGYCYKNSNIYYLEKLTGLDFFNYYNIPQKRFSVMGNCG